MVKKKTAKKTAGKKNGGTIPETTDAKTIGWLLGGLTEQRVRQLVAEGVMPKAKTRGRYPIAGCVRGYISYLTTETRAGRGKEDDDRFRRARAEVHEIEAAHKRKSLMPVDMIAEQIVEVFVAFVRRLDALAPRLAALVPAKIRPGIRTQLDDEIRELRQQLARGLEQLCADLEARARDLEAAAAANARRVGRRRKSPAAGKRRAGAVSK